jgi:hypothetical protein
MNAVKLFTRNMIFVVTECRATPCNVDKIDPIFELHGVVRRGVTRNHVSCKQALSSHEPICLTRVSPDG